MDSTYGGLWRCGVSFDFNEEIRARQGGNDEEHRGRASTLKHACAYVGVGDKVARTHKVLDNFHQMLRSHAGTFEKM